MMRGLAILSLLAAVGGFAPLTQSRTSSTRAPRAVVQQSALLGSLNRVSERQGEVVVVKYGGHAMTNDDRAAEFAGDIALLQSQVAELNEAVVQLQRDMATLKQCDESSSSFHQPTPTTGAGFPLHYKIKPMTSVCTRSSPIHDLW